ncbi:MAG: MATE family multidrug resistance protein [Polaribacter sp.]|jgi:MATE family multidrug resistance protein
MNKAILRLAIPNILSNISVPLISSVDTALMGRLSEQHLGAVGIGAMVFNLIYWNFGFLRMGTTGITAQAYGAKDAQNVIHTLARAMVVVVLVAFAILLLQNPIASLGFQFMNVPADQIVIVQSYFDIRIWAAPATLGIIAIMGWFFGMQNAIYPLIMTIFISVVNVFFSFYFIMEMGMEADGVAWGTVIAQYAGLLLGACLFVYRYSNYSAHFQRKALFAVEAFKDFLLINRDIFIRTVCLTFSFAFFYSQSAVHGSLTLAANVILLQFVNWMSYGIDGFAYAAESLVGKHAGARQTKELQKTVRLTFFWGMAMAVGFSLLFWFFGNNLLQLFTNQEDIILTAMPFMFWVILFPLLSTPCYLWDGIFVGLTASREMRDAMLLSIVFFIGAFYTFQRWGNNGLWASLLLFMVVRGITLWWMYNKISPPRTTRK